MRWRLPVLVTPGRWARWGRTSASSPGPPAGTSSTSRPHWRTQSGCRAFRCGCRSERAARQREAGVGGVNGAKSRKKGRGERERERNRGDTPTDVQGLSHGHVQVLHVVRARKLAGAVLAGLRAPTHTTGMCCRGVARKVQRRERGRARPPRSACTAPEGPL